MRVTDNMSLNSTISNILNYKSQLNDTIEKIGTQKNINRASDNPAAAMRIIDIQQGKAANAQYQNNMDSANTWLSATDTVLSSASSLLGQASAIAIGQSNTAASDRTIAAQNVQSIIDTVASLANQKLGDRYLFSGSSNYVAPFSTTCLPNPTIEAAGAADGNTFKGTVTSSGNYTGSTNKSYVLKITNAGSLDTATYQFSTDGGNTWNGTDLSFDPGSNSNVSVNTSGSVNVNVGDGVTITVDDLSGNVKYALGGGAIANNTTWANIFTGALRNSAQNTKTSGAGVGSISAATKWSEINTGVLLGSAQNTKTSGAGGGFISAATKWSEINTGGDASNIADGDTITISGTKHDGSTVSGLYTINNAATGTVNDLLSQIQTSFGGTVTATIDANGKIIVTDSTVGNSQLSLSLSANNEGGGTLDFGTFGNNITNGDTITISGTKHDGTAVSGSYTITNAATGTVNDLLSRIQTIFGGTVTPTIDANGKIIVTDTKAGDSQLSLSLVANNQGGGTLDFGTFGNNVTNGDTITISGTKHDGTPVSGTYTITDATTGTVNDLLSRIQTIFSGTVTATIDANGKIIVTDTTAGNSQLSLSLIANNQGGGTIHFGTFSASTEGGSMQLAASAKSFGMNDIFHVNATASSYYSVNAAVDNTSTGTVTPSGNYTGATNKSYVLKITNTGALVTATYQFSTDGGNTWNGTDLSLAGGIISLGDGVNLTFNDAGGTEHFDQGDKFHVNATAGGYYSGNDTNLSAMINRGTSLNYNISGAQVFTAAANNGNGVDVFATLNALKNALNNNDTQGISNQQDNLQKAQNQITMNQSLCGVKQDQIQVTKTNLTNLNANLDSILSNIQDADTAKLAVMLSMEQTALEASYTVANKIGNMTILNFLGSGSK